MTEWDEFRNLGPKDFHALMRVPNVLDARRIYDPDEFGELNFAGVGLGPGAAYRRLP